MEMGFVEHRDKKVHQTSTVCMVLYGTVATLLAS